jgi:pyruvate formate lyase activating enzyme
LALSGTPGEMPLIVDVARGRTSDGPGLRSVVFFKGCPLECDFCQNPECQRPEVEMAFHAGKCIACGLCEAACRSGALSMNLAERIDRARCERCARCAEACPTSALRRVGEPYSPAAIAEILMRDEPFYRHSNGGVTLSGGECTRYPTYVNALLAILKQARVHVAIETSGHFSFDAFQRQILPFVDLVYFDIKLASQEAHQAHTGRSNTLILENLERLLAVAKVPVAPRVPLIPGITDTEENLDGIIGILRDLGVKEVTLLPYNPMGIDMYRALGRPAPAIPERFTSPDSAAETLALFRQLAAGASMKSWSRR